MASSKSNGALASRNLCKIQPVLEVLRLSDNHPITIVTTILQFARVVRHRLEPDDTPFFSIPRLAKVLVPVVRMSGYYITSRERAHAENIHEGCHRCTSCGRQGGPPLAAPARPRQARRALRRRLPHH